MRIYILLFLIIFTGCSLKETKQEVNQNDYLVFPQNVSIFRTTAKLSSYDSDSLHEEFKSNYFSPWNSDIFGENIEDAMFGFRTYTNKKPYVLENNIRANDDYFTKMKEMASFEKFETQNQKAITIKNTNLRVFPTNRPLFRDFGEAGIGFSFDYMQNSYLFISSPIFISHYSKDGAWAFVKASFASGWVKADNIAIVNEKEMREYEKVKKIVIIKDEIATFYKNDKFASYVKLGTILPFVSENEKYFISYIYSKDGQHEEIYIDKSSASSFPLPFNDENIKKITDVLLGEKYGWGGLYENRDCSAMIKDFFATFGIWLPRNSAAQRTAGVYINIANLSNEKKEEMLKEYGVPFLSVIYMPGHSMLYSGEIDGKISAFHNIWGVKTVEDGKVGRFIIGRTVISDLYLGKLIKNSNKNSLLIDRVQGFTIIAPTTLKARAKILTTYKESVVLIKDNRVFFKDNSSLVLDDGVAKDEKQRVQNADIKGQFFENYKKGVLKTPPQNDPGRARNELFFKKLYGENRVEVEKNLVNVVWLKSSENRTLLFNKNEGAAVALQNVSDELDKLPKKFLEFLVSPAGTYNYRKIANTNRLSAHSFGIAIDINVNSSHYWLWTKKFEYQNKIPYKIVEIFEKYGFIWGGKWYHYDTMHFEYRPELL